MAQWGPSPLFMCQKKVSLICLFFDSSFLLRFSKNAQHFDEMFAHQLGIDT
jgi:hypothetical protein